MFHASHVNTISFSVPIRNYTILKLSGNENVHNELNKWIFGLIYPCCALHKAGLILDCEGKGTFFGAGFPEKKGHFAC